MKPLKKIALLPILIMLVIVLSCNKTPSSKPEQSGSSSSSSSGSMDAAILDKVQSTTLDYFLEGKGAGIKGMAQDRSSGGSLATGGTGMGIMAMIVGIERGFVTRSAVAVQVSNILSFYSSAPKYRGAWPHYMDTSGNATGFDSALGGDIVETAYAAEGFITAIQYFTNNNSTENYIRAKANTLWTNIEWDSYVNTNVVQWHRTSGGIFDRELNGFNECMLVYLLGMASPTHPISMLCYTTGWVNSDYINNNSYFSIKQYVRRQGYDISLFWIHYSFLGFDPRVIDDRNIQGAGSYFNVFRNIALIHREYCKTFPYTGYGTALWGLTASDGPVGYSAWSPANDNGTIAPTAAISSMPYTPYESYTVLTNLYYGYPYMWGQYGFVDAINVNSNWYDTNIYLAIDQGPIVIMIENYRSRLIWKLFMSHPNITNLLNSLESQGWSIHRQTY